ncbi:MAG: CPBP family intramembrane metalloprotease [Clostridiales bacterium]|nr:CPBP family intramembrane metalloprotease [Clostridiales bacterium]
MRRKVLKPWHGLVFFILIMTVFFLICVPMQMYWGMYGLAATELLILVISLIFAKAMGYPLKVMFPVKGPGFLPLLGVFVLWLSTYLFTMVLMLIQFRLFPRQMMEVSGGLNQVIFSVPFLISVFITAIMPAVCEEAVHRGVIIHTLYSIRKEWIVVLIMGIYFGFFHSDPLRFVPTAVLGAAMSYIMLETENMVYPAFFHFINNCLPLVLQQVLLSRTTEYSNQMDEIMASEAITNIPIASIGIYMMLTAAVPFGLYLGNYLIHHRKGVARPFIPREKSWKIILGIVVPTAAILGIGVLLIIYGILFDPVMKEILQEVLRGMGR